MGLLERRIAAAYQKDSLPGWKQKLEAITGYPLEFELAWDELIKEGFASDYPVVLDYNFFIPLERALTSICADDLGKDALRGRINKISIQSKRPKYSLEVKASGGTLELDADPSFQRDESALDDYAARITSFLEKVL